VFKQVFYNLAGASPFLYSYLFDTDGTNATGAHTTLFNVSFLQYDIRQADQVIVNAPMPVSVR